MKSLLLDLRSDPGGLRDEAVQAADLFLDPRQEILVSRGRAPGDNHRWSATSAAALARAARGGAGEPGNRQRRGDHRRRAAGSRPRAGRGRHDLRQGDRPDAVPARHRRRAPDHDGALVHAERSLDPGGVARLGDGRGAPAADADDLSLRRRPAARRRRRHRARRGARPDTLTTAEQRFAAVARRAAGGVPRRADRLRAGASPRRAGPRPRRSGWTGDAGRGAAAAGGAGGPAWPTAPSTAGQRIVDQQLGYEVARYTFGPDGGAAPPGARRPPDRPGGRATARAQTPQRAARARAARRRQQLTDPLPGRRTAP